MKKILCLICLLVISSYKLNAQASTAQKSTAAETKQKLIDSLTYSPTTEEEYNYLTKGYQIQTETGLDMKKGYSFIDYGHWGLNHGLENRDVTFKGLVRDGCKKPCAILAIYKRTDITNGATFYVCIPSTNASEDLWNRTLALMNQDFYASPDGMETLCWAVMKFASIQLTN